MEFFFVEPSWLRLRRCSVNTFTLIPDICTYRTLHYNTNRLTGQTTETSPIQQ